MNKTEIIKRQNWVFLGQYYFQRGLDCASHQDYKSAELMIKEGLDFIPCDCYSISSKHGVDLILNNIDKIDQNDVAHYHFVKAFIFGYRETQANLEEALAAINNYLNSRNDAYGNYLKAKILMSSGNSKKAKQLLIESNSNKREKYLINVINFERERENSALDSTEIRNHL